MRATIGFALAATVAALLVFIAPGTHAAAAEPQEVTLTVHPDEVLHRVDPMVYGHFLEHIYHSVNGGLWGELVWNRSFEQNRHGRWSVSDGHIVQRGMGTNVRLVFGDPGWTDYEFTLEARKTGGAEGFLILFRVKDEDTFYWCNLGGWGNEHHQLERGRAGEGRWGALGPAVEGAIEEGRWYKIRVRCEGNHFEVFLDGEPLIEYTDPGAHLQGAVGIGTWSTQAEFRNLKVTSLDGETLFEGLPESLVSQGTAQFWEPVGQPRTAVTEGDALNGNFAQQIEGRGSEAAGISQTPFCIRAGQSYVGSLWAAGNAPEGLIVRLTDGDDVLAETKLPAVAGDWQEYPIELEAQGTCQEATLQILLAGDAKVQLDQVSLMPATWKAQGGFRPDLLEAADQLRPPIIRWPGGCFASAYRWKAGIGPQHEREAYPREIWDDIDVNSFGTDEFIAMCRRVGAEPLIVVNIGTPNWNPDPNPEEFMQDIRDWIEYCNGSADTKWGSVRAANGHPQPYNVKYWEIDNETWHMGAGEYAEAVRRIAPMMRQCDPTIKLGACGSGGYGRSAREWNRTIIDQCADLIDYLSIHHYEGPDNFAGGPWAYEEFFITTREQIAESENPDLKIYVSEWNAQSTDWRTGLYCGGLLNAFERQGDVVTMAGPALFLRHVSATAWDNAFINFDQCSWFPAPNYVVMKLWHDHTQPILVACDGAERPLNVTATRSEDGALLCVKVVNPTDSPVPLTVQLADTPVWAARANWVAPGSLRARNTLDAPDAVRPVPGDIVVRRGTASLELPPLSAAVIDLRPRANRAGSEKE